MDNGIIHLLINTIEKDCFYHEYSLGHYLVDSENLEEELKILVKKFQLDGIKFISTSTQNKDQISFYYIPYTRESIINRNIIAESNEE